MNPISKLLQNGGITWDSFKASLENEKADKATMDSAKSIFNSIDKDGDGTITKNEWDKNADKALKDADIDGDGVISEEEAGKAPKDNLFKQFGAKVSNTCLSAFSKATNNNNADNTGTDASKVSDATPAEDTTDANNDAALKDETTISEPDPEVSEFQTDISEIEPKIEGDEINETNTMDEDLPADSDENGDDSDISEATKDVSDSTRKEKQVFADVHENGVDVVAKEYDNGDLETDIKNNKNGTHTNVVIGKDVETVNAKYVQGCKTTVDEESGKQKDTSLEAEAKKDGDTYHVKGNATRITTSDNSVSDGSYTNTKQIKVDTEGDKEASLSTVTLTENADGSEKKTDSVNLTSKTDGGFHVKGEKSESTITEKNGRREINKNSQEVAIDGHELSAKASVSTDKNNELNANSVEVRGNTKTGVVGGTVEHTEADESGESKTTTISGSVGTADGTYSAEHKNVTDNGRGNVKTATTNASYSDNSVKLGKTNNKENTDSEDGEKEIQKKEQSVEYKQQDKQVVLTKQTVLKEEGLPDEDGNTPTVLSNNSKAQTLTVGTDEIAADYTVETDNRDDVEGGTYKKEHVQYGSDVVKADKTVTEATISDGEKTEETTTKGAEYNKGNGEVTLTLNKSNSTTGASAEGGAETLESGSSNKTVTVGTKEGVDVSYSNTKISSDVKGNTSTVNQDASYNKEDGLQLSDSKEETKVTTLNQGSEDASEVTKTDQVGRTNTVTFTDSDNYSVNIGSSNNETILDEDGNGNERSIDKSLNFSNEGGAQTLTYTDNKGQKLTDEEGNPFLGESSSTDVTLNNSDNAKGISVTKGKSSTNSSGTKSASYTASAETADGVQTYGAGYTNTTKDGVTREHTVKSDSEGHTTITRRKTEGNTRESIAVDLQGFDSSSITSSQTTSAGTFSVSLKNVPGKATAAKPAADPAPAAKTSHMTRGAVIEDEGEEEFFDEDSGSFGEDDSSIGDEDDFFKDDDYSAEFEDSESDDFAEGNTEEPAEPEKKDTPQALRTDFGYSNSSTGTDVVGHVTTQDGNITNAGAAFNQSINGTNSKTTLGGEVEYNKDGDNIYRAGASHATYDKETGKFDNVVAGEVKQTGSSATEVKFAGAKRIGNGEGTAEGYVAGHAEVRSYGTHTFGAETGMVFTKGAKIGDNTQDAELMRIKQEQEAKEAALRKGGDKAADNAQKAESDTGAVGTTTMLNGTEKQGMDDLLTKSNNSATTDEKSTTEPTDDDTYIDDEPKDDDTNIDGEPIDDDTYIDGEPTDDEVYIDGGSEGDEQHEQKVGDTKIAGEDDVNESMQNATNANRQTVIGGFHAKAEADSNGNFNAKAEGFVNVSDNATVYGSVQHTNGQVEKSEHLGIPNAGGNPLDNNDRYQNNAYRNAALNGNGYGNSNRTTNVGAGFVGGNEKLAYGAAGNATFNDGTLTNFQAGAGVERVRTTAGGHIQSFGADAAVRRDIANNTTSLNTNLNYNQQFTNGTELYTNVGYNKTYGGVNAGETYYAQGGIRKPLGKKLTAFGNTQVTSGSATGGAANFGVEVGASYQVGPGHAFAKYGTGMGNTNADFKMGSNFEVGYAMNLDKLTGKSKRKKN